MMIRWMSQKAFTEEDFAALRRKPGFRNSKYDITYINKWCLKIQHCYARWKERQGQVINRKIKCKNNHNNTTSLEYHKNTYSNTINYDDIHFNEGKEKLKFENDRNFGSRNVDNLHEYLSHTKSLHHANDNVKRKSIAFKKPSFNQNSSSKNWRKSVIKIGLDSNAHHLK